MGKGASVPVTRVSFDFTAPSHFVGHDWQNEAQLDAILDLRKQHRLIERQMQGRGKP